MTAFSTTVRATHLVTNAAWFGGSLMGAVGLNGAAAHAFAIAQQVIQEEQVEAGREGDPA